MYTAEDTNILYCAIKQLETVSMMKSLVEACFDINDTYDADEEEREKGREKKGLDTDRFQSLDSLLNSEIFPSLSKVELCKHISFTRFPTLMTRGLLSILPESRSFYPEEK